MDYRTLIWFWIDPARTQAQTDIECTQACMEWPDKVDSEKICIQTKQTLSIINFKRPSPTPSVRAVERKIRWLDSESITWSKQLLQLNAQTCSHAADGHTANESVGVLDAGRAEWMCAKVELLYVQHLLVLIFLHLWNNFPLKRDLSRHWREKHKHTST